MCWWILRDQDQDTTRSAKCPRQGTVLDKTSFSGIFQGKNQEYLVQSLVVLGSLKALWIHSHTSPHISGISLKVGTVVGITNPNFVITYAADFLAILIVIQNMALSLEKPQGSGSEQYGL